jgi:hypothetical protein
VKVIKINFNKEQARLVIKEWEEIKEAQRKVQMEAVKVDVSECGPMCICRSFYVLENNVFVHKPCGLMLSPEFSPLSVNVTLIRHLLNCWTRA